MLALRNVLGVVVGYLIFAISALMLFRMGGIDPHREANLGTTATVVVCGAVFAFAGGYVGKLIASTRTMIVNFVLAGVMAGFAAVSLFMSAGSRYTQTTAIFVFAPVSLFGGYLRRRSEI